MSLIKINHDQSVFDIVTDFQSYFENISQAIDFPNKWNKQTCFEIEIKKSFLRGLIRYSHSSICLIRHIKKIYNQQFNNNDNLNWLSLPYPMIHLPKDQVERGIYHYDEKKKHFYTCWIPLIDYEYNSLSFFKYQNKFVELLSPILLRSNLCEVASSKIKAKKGNVFFWKGKHIHKGNLNISNTTSMAVQFKLTKDVYVYEQSSSLQNKIDLNENFMNFSKSEIRNLFDEYNKVILEIKKNKVNKDYKKGIKNILKDFNKKSLPISFALSLLSQRIITNRKIFHIKNNEKFANILDLISLFVGSANLISLKRLIKKNYMNSDLLDFLKNNDVFNAIPFGTFQFLSITENSKNFKINNNFSY